MIIFPAMDLRDGKCVRLYQGDFSTTSIVGENPLETAMGFKAKGAEFFHMVDLDGALKGNVQNIDTVSRIVRETKIPVQLGGGIRTLETIDTLLSIGVARVILGTAALNNRGLVKTAVKKYGEKIAVGIDAREGFVAAEGWLEVSKVNYIDFGKQMESIGVKTIIFTDISKDGTLTGPNFEQTLKLNETVSCDIIASGGMKDLEDLKILRKENLYGAIVGKSIYSGTIDLAQAIEVGR
jgi:phosphoribosylformimino-5-aminoimidazole carboxamide ribotide isomerase